MPKKRKEKKTIFLTLFEKRLSLFYLWRLIIRDVKHYVLDMQKELYIVYCLIDAEFTIFYFLFIYKILVANIFSSTKQQANLLILGFIGIFVFFFFFDLLHEVQSKKSLYRSLFCFSRCGFPSGDFLQHD
jgi:hypothetical protein